MIFFGKSDVGGEKKRKKDCPINFVNMRGTPCERSWEISHR
jgi:hypothetical protein